jgi:hypothetical protein
MGQSIFGRWFDTLTGAERTDAQRKLDVAPLFTPIEGLAGTAHTFDVSDLGIILMTSSASSVAVTIPNEDTQQFPEFAEFSVIQAAAGAVTFVAAAGVTILKADASAGTTNGFLAGIMAKRVSRNVWFLEGNYI